MPTTYTHDYFGKKVYQKLPEEIKRVIRENGELYRIGLHGPDILFYYMVSKNPITQFGVNMHKEKGRAFFEQGMETVRRTGDKALLSYLLGFGCHYLLDSYCHPYVDEMADAGVISHTLLEKEYDRFLMEESGKNPYIYRPSDCIVPRYQWAKEIHKVLPTVKTVNIYISMRMMKVLTNLMVCNDGEKRRKRIQKLFKLTGSESAMSLLEHFMKKEPIPGSSIPVARLNTLFWEAVEEVPEELMELYSLSKEKKKLSDRWDRTYNG